MDRLEITTKEVSSTPTAGYGHGPGGVFSAPGISGASNAIQIPGGKMNRTRRKKKTTKEVTITMSQNGQTPVVVIVPDQITIIPVEIPVAPMTNMAVGTFDDDEPCPYCDTFLMLLPDGELSEWVQCPNCGNFLYISESDSDFHSFHLYAVGPANEIFNVTPPDTAPMALLSPVNDNAAAEAVQYKAISLMLATLKANYNAKAGETIAGNLTRGGDGKFSSGGGADPTISDQEKADIKKRVEALRAPKPKKGKAAPKPKKGKAAPKGKKAKPTVDEKQAAKDKIQGENLTKTLGGDLTEAITAVDMDPESGVNEPYRTQLLEKGLIQENPGGTTTLTGAGRSLMSAAASNNPNNIKRALQRGQVAAKATAARKTTSDQKKADRAAALRAKADKLQQTTKEVTTADGSIAVFKQKNGAWRWITYTSSSFEDGDRETVTQKAIETDVERADASGDYGPLRWYHIPGFDIGKCDFNMVAGRILIESGTFDNELVALKMAAAAPDLEVSAGFLRPRYEPVDGVYNTFRRFERSLLPRGIASNKFTSFFVKDENMATIKEKIDAFVAKLGGGPEAEQIAASIIDKAETVTKEAVALGVTHKAVVEGSDVEEAAETPEEEAAEDQFVGDLTVAEFTQLMAGILHTTGATNPTAPVTKEIIVAALGEALAQPTAATTKAASDIAALETTVKSLSGQLTAVTTMLTELTSDQPRIMRGFVASQSNETLTQVPTLKSLPGADEIDNVAAQVAARMNGNNGGQY